MKDALAARPGTRWALLITVVWCVANAVWFEYFRFARLWDHEEVTYAELVSAFARRGLHRPWEELYSGHYGPMQALLGAPSQWLFGVDQATVIWENIALTAVTGMVVFFLARRLADPAAGLVACALTLLLPGMLENSRGALTMVPATAFAAIAIGALAAGGGLRRPGWSVVAGVAIGLMSLSRPMSLAFIPGIAAPALAWSKASGADVRTVLRNGALATAGAVVVSMWWWVSSADDVMRYLSTGAAGVGTGGLVEVFNHRLYELRAYLGPIQFGAFLGYTPRLAALAFFALWWWQRRKKRPPAPLVLDQRGVLPAWPLALAVAVSLAVSLASDTIGWLMLPLVPWIVVGGVAAVRRRLQPTAWATWVGIVVVPVLLVAVLSSTVWATPGNRFTWCIEPWQKTSACSITSRSQAAAWERDIEAIAARTSVAFDSLVDHDRSQVAVAIAARDHIVLPSTIRFQGWLAKQPWSLYPDSLPRDPGAGLQLDEVLADAGVAVIAEDVPDVILFRTNVDPAHLRRELLANGFARCSSVRLPDDRLVRILVREPVPPGACETPAR